jgi:type 2 lantibiotic biosynthesis protein LanM
LDSRQQHLRLRAATIDEILSDAFEPASGPQADAALAARRLAAWRQASAAGDPSLFARRLERDRLSAAAVADRFAAVRQRADASCLTWIEDAAWIEAALQKHATGSAATVGHETAPLPFQDLFTSLVEHADTLVWSDLDARVFDNLEASARANLRRSLLQALCELTAPPLYERFAKARGTGAGISRQEGGGKTDTSLYDRFAAEMTTGGFRRLFEDKPVLLRLIASLVRQWIDTSREFIARLDADLPSIRRDLLQTSTNARVAEIEGDVSDPHNGGRAVLLLRFTDGARVAYKPKDLRLDVAWHNLIARLNRAGAPLELKAVWTLARNGYGWTEFIAHTGCADQADCERFFRRAGVWLALLHCFAATDMHQENMIAAGDHPVPIDLETILQPNAEEHKVLEPEGEAFNAAMEIIGNSVMTVGLLPAYGRSVDNNVFAMGGMTADWGARTIVAWNNVNSDAMRPVKVKEGGTTNTNLPHIGGRYAKFADHIDSFVSGFADYAEFLLRQIRGATANALLDGFTGLPVRRVVRPTRFYYMLLQRLKNHRSMDDGAIWSAQADFVTRLADWDKESDPLWPLHRAERSALLALNVPHFVTSSDGTEISDATGISARTDATCGLERARARMQNLDEKEIAWQIDVIRANTNRAARTAPNAELTAILAADAPLAPTRTNFLAEADTIAAELSRLAIRRGTGAAWIGLDWLGDSEAFQLVCLGPDLYNGAAGIAVFLAAHAAVTRSKPSGELARAGVAQLRKNLESRNAPRMARGLGIGAATGLGSIVYGLAVMARCLGDGELLTDAHKAAQLLTDELIAADKQLDIMGGSAGAILALLRLYRDTQSDEVLGRAAKCGEHLLAQNRLGPEGRRSWVGQGFGAQALNGMSHGAAGFAYALAALAAATGREEFAEAASECLTFEDSSYDATRQNWPDLRSPAHPAWPCQWCHGAPGIGLARLATVKHAGKNASLDADLKTDIGNALDGAERGWPAGVDTLCCGTLGSIEFFCEAASTLDRHELRALAARKLAAVLNRAAAAGDYRWNNGKRQFNLGLFRGLAGVGYTLLRQARTSESDTLLPNILIWE